MVFLGQHVLTRKRPSPDSMWNLVRTIDLEEASITRAFFKNSFTFHGNLAILHYYNLKLFVTLIIIATIQSKRAQNYL